MWSVEWDWEEVDTTLPESETQDRSRLHLISRPWEHNNLNQSHQVKLNNTLYSTYYIGVSTGTKSGKKYQYREEPYVMQARVPAG